MRKSVEGLLYKSTGDRKLAHKWEILFKHADPSIAGTSPSGCCPCYLPTFTVLTGTSSCPLSPRDSRCYEPEETVTPPGHWCIFPLHSESIFLLYLKINFYLAYKVIRFTVTFRYIYNVIFAFIPLPLPCPSPSTSCRSPFFLQTVPLPSHSTYFPLPPRSPR